MRLDTFADTVETWEVVEAAYDIDAFPRHTTRAVAISAIYWLLDADGTIAYVGQSKDVTRRIHEHRRAARCAVLAAYQPCKPKLRMPAERVYIMLHQPRLNRDDYGPLQAGLVRGKPGWNRGTTTLSEEQQRRALELHADGLALSRIVEMLGLNKRDGRVARFIKRTSGCAARHPH